MSKCAKGFSLVELLILSSALLVLASVAIPTINETMQYYRTETALQMVIGQIRQARQASVDKRTAHMVVFNLSGSVRTLQRQDFGWQEISDIPLPEKTAFHIPDGAPASGEYTPDGMGGYSPVYFRSGNSILFRPDGTAVDAYGQVVSGIVYIAEPGKPETARAITVFGSTGRIRSWKFEDGIWK